jgi:outer membrane receptor protein involved in Fe transport
MKRIVSIIFFSTVLSFSAYAQSTGDIQGTVTDSNRAKIPGARVRLLTNPGLQSSTTTDEMGKFEFRGLMSGTYLLEVNAPGFAPYTHDEIRLARGESKELQITLAVASITESVVVTANGTAERIEEAAKVLSVIDSQQIDQRHELAFSEALRGTPGVRVQQQGSPGALATLRLRGQRTFDTAILLDGLRVRDAGDINGSAISLVSDLPLVSLDRVEILRGSGSSIYGTHAIGGVVNVIPDSGTQGLHFSSSFDGGSLGTYRERLQVAGGAERFGFNIGVDRLDVRRGIDKDDAYGNSSFIARAQFKPTHSIAITGTFFGDVANARVNDNPFALPGAFSGQQFPSAVAGITFQPDFNNPDQGRRNRLLVGSGRFTQVVSDRVSYSLAYQRVGTNRRNYNGPAVDPRFTSFVPFGDFELTSVNNGTIDTFDGRLNFTLGRSNLATAGFEFERESFFQSSQPSFSTFNNTTDHQRTFAVFGQDQFAFLDDRLRFSLGARIQSYRIRSADRPGELAGRDAESSITGDGSVAYLFRTTGTKLRGHIGNGFRAPSLFERFGEGTFGSAGPVRFGDPTLKAEQSISVDGGFDQRLATDRVSLGATYFYTRLQRVVAFTGFSVDPLGLGRFSGYLNRPGGLSRGVETYLEAAPWKGAEIRAAYTFTNSDRSVPSHGLQPEYVIPKHLIGFFWSQRYRPFLVSLEVNRTGSYLAPVFENTSPFRMAELTFPGYTKADVFASYERSASEKVKVTLFAGVENLFDRTYYENGFLAPGAVGRGGIKLRF